MNISSSFRTAALMGVLALDVAACAHHPQVKPAAAPAPTAIPAATTSAQEEDGPAPKQVFIRSEATRRTHEASGTIEFNEICKKVETKLIKEDGVRIQSIEKCETVITDTDNKVPLENRIRTPEQRESAPPARKNPYVQTI